MDYDGVRRTREEIEADVRFLRNEEFKPACEECHHMNGIKACDPADLAGAENVLLALIAQDRHYMRELDKMIRSGQLGAAQMKTAKDYWSDVHRSMHQIEQLCSHVRAALAEDWSALEAVTGEADDGKSN